MSEDDGFPMLDIPASATSPETAVQFLIDRLVSQHQVEAAEADSIKQRIVHRESLGSTAIGQGIAIPHAFCNINLMAGVIGRSPMASLGLGDRTQSQSDSFAL